jgi:hypothetical protein
VTPRELAGAILARPLGPERVGKAIRHVESRAQFEAMLVTIGDVALRDAVDGWLRPAVERKFP